MKTDVALWQIILVITMRYVLFAGLTYLIFYVLRKNPWHLKIQQRLPSQESVLTELKYSLSTIFIFSLVIQLTLFTPVRDYSQVYTDLDAYPMWYFWLSIPLVIFGHDTYFYWMHRLMHWKPIYRYVHRVHHLSHNPTPLAAFSFHPLEAFLEIAYLPMIAFMLPTHRFVLFFFGLYMMAMNVIGHLGYELFPKSFINSVWKRWLNSSTHHNMHHKYSRYNYGLYFNLWDRWMGTNHPKYTEEFVDAKKDRQIAQTSNASNALLKIQINKD